MICEKQTNMYFLKAIYLIINFNLKIMNRHFKLPLLITFLLICTGAFAQTDTLGLFTDHMDIGNPKNKGNAQYDKVTHTYALKGSGYNIWFNRDEFQYLFKKVKGDFTVTANFRFIGEKGNGHRK